MKTVFILLFTTLPVLAIPTVWFGQGNDAAAARASFTAAMGQTFTEDFEGYTPTTFSGDRYTPDVLAPRTFNFDGVTGRIPDVPWVRVMADPNGGQMIVTDADFTIFGFSQAIQGFGFEGTLRTELSSNPVIGQAPFSVRTEATQPGAPWIDARFPFDDGPLPPGTTWFFGWADPDTYITTVAFNDVNLVKKGAGFDDLTVGVFGVSDGGNTIWLFGLAVGALVALTFPGVDARENF